MRQRKIVLALGANGVGKTTLVKALAEAYRQKCGMAIWPDEAACIRVLDPASQFEEFGGEWPGRSGVKEWINTLTANGDGPSKGGWGPGMLILDDADRYIDPHSYNDFRDVWIANRHLGLDVLVSAHRPQGIPKELIGCCSEIFLFQQEEPLAMEYLMKIPALKASLNGAELPTENFVALHVKRGERSPQFVHL